MTTGIYVTMFMPERKFDALQKGSVQALLGWTGEGERISVAVLKPNVPPSADEAKELLVNPVFVAIVQNPRMLNSQKPGDVSDFAKYLKVSEDDARAKLVECENSTDKDPIFMATLVPKSPATPSLNPGSTGNPQLKP